MTQLPKIGSFVLVPFGAKGCQVGHVVAHTRTGKAKVRAWNGTQGKWMPNTRTMDPEHLTVEWSKDRLPPVAPPSITR